MTLLDQKSFFPGIVVSGKRRRIVPSKTCASSPGVCPVEELGCLPRLGR